MSGMYLQCGTAMIRWVTCSSSRIYFLFDGEERNQNSKIGALMATLLCTDLDHTFLLLINFNQTSSNITFILFVYSEQHLL